VVESFVQVNVPVTAGKKLKTYESVDGAANIVESEAVTLTDGAGNEIIGQKPMAASLPVVLASDQSPIPVIGTFSEAKPTLGTVTSVPASAIASTYLIANLVRIGAVFFNDSANRFLYLKLAAGVSSASYTVRVGPRGSFELPYPSYVGVVEGVFTAGVRPMPRCHTMRYCIGADRTIRAKVSFPSARSPRARRMR